VGEIERPPAGEHRVGERRRLLAVESAEERRHEEGGHLVVRDLAGGVGTGQLPPLGRLDPSAVPLSGDQAGREH
jgi:hypothetical protein